MTLLLGCIADDFTGATDLANTLVKQGMRTTQVIGVPDSTFAPDNNDAIVIALKSRTIPAEQAVIQSLEALSWLHKRGAKQFFWKYCSTFDSTDAGNIGPVADALLDALGENFTIACPAFPTAGRTIYNGHLFVGPQLLSDSGMKDHPLTPMRDANLVNVLQRQTKHPVGLVSLDTIQAGPSTIRQAFDNAKSAGRRYVITDAVTDGHLRDIGKACSDFTLITGGSGVALGLPENFRHAGTLHNTANPVPPDVSGRQAILSGSCSTATREQVSRWSSDNPAFQIDPLALHAGEDVLAQATGWLASLADDATPLFYSSVAPETIAHVQDRLGRVASGELIEDFMGTLASSLVNSGFKRLIVAGGETSGAVVQTLGITALDIGPEIDPGVPWTKTHGKHAIALALKSGNFGSEDFFAKAFEMLS